MQVWESQRECGLICITSVRESATIYRGRRGRKQEEQWKGKGRGRVFDSKICEVMRIILKYLCLVERKPMKKE